MAIRTPVVIDGDEHTALAPGDSISFQYDKIRHVDGTNGDDSWDGMSSDTPWKTLDFASSFAPQACTILVAPGTYTDPVTWTIPNCDIVGTSARSGVVNITGSFTTNLSATNTSLRLENLSLAGGLTTAGAGRVYMEGCNISSLTKTGSGYNRDFNSDIATITVSGTGQLNLTSGDYGNITVNNAAALVTVQHPSSIAVTQPIAVTAGMFLISDGTVVTSTSQATAIDAAAGTTLLLGDVKLIDNAQLPTKLTVNGNYSFANLVYNDAASTKGGTAVQLPYSVYTDNITATSIASMTGYTAVTNQAQSLTGKIGELVDSHGTSAVVPDDGTTTVVGTVSLSKGRWAVYGWASITPTDGTLTTVTVSITPSLSPFPYAGWGGTNPGALPIAAHTGPHFYTIATDNYVVSLQVSRTGGDTAPVDWQLTAQRIA